MCIISPNPRNEPDREAHVAPNLQPRELRPREAQGVDWNWACVTPGPLVLPPP